MKHFNQFYKMGMPSDIGASQDPSGKYGKVAHGRIESEPKKNGKLQMRQTWQREPRPVSFVSEKP